MFKSRKYVIETVLDSSELSNRVDNFIDFNYSSKVGSIEISKKYYGKRLSSNSFQVWKTPAMKIGIGDQGLSESFRMDIEDGKLLLTLKSKLVYSIIIFLFISIPVLLLTGSDLLNISYWISASFLLTFFAFYLILNNLTIKSIIEDFDKMIKQNGS